MRAGLHRLAAFFWPDTRLSSDGRSHKPATLRMRTLALKARSIAFTEATAAAGLVCLLVVAFPPAFLRLWQLMVTEPWLAPLVSISTVQFVAASLVAARRGTLNRETVKTELFIKALITLAYIAGFAVQRMWDTAPETLPDDSAFKSIGHAVSGSLITIELGRFGSILRQSGLLVWPVEMVVQVLSKTYAGELRRQVLQEKVETAKAEGVVKGARKGWNMARDDYFDTGTVGPPPKTEELSGIIPAVRVDDTDPDIPAVPPAEGGEDGGGGLDSGPRVPPTPSP